MKTTIFAHKGVIGILSSPDAEGFFAKPGGNNLGCVLDASSVEISEEALELLKSVRKGLGGLGDFDVFQSGDKVVIGWLGGYTKCFSPSEIETSRNYCPNLLKSSLGVVTPQEFIEFVDAEFA